jgi:CelD/BcsL family acetyltransferase involved in cellulose biosynthesis
MSALNTFIAHNMDELPPALIQWDQLLQEDPDATVFQTREWIESWWAAFGAQNKLMMIGVLADARLIGIAPLMRDARGARILFVGRGQADYQDIIARPEDRKRVIRAVIEVLHQTPGWSVMEFGNLPESSPTTDLLPAASRLAGFRILRGTDEICPVLLREGPEPTPHSLAGKYRVRRASNYFRRQGDLVVTDLRDPHEALSYLAAFFDQHIRRWKGTPTPSLFNNEAKRQFYENLIERLLPTGHLLFSVATLDGQPIAFHFGFDFGGRVFWYKPSFEPRLAQHSPGTVMIEHLIRHVLNNDRRELDFTLGAEPFKQRYANAQRINVNLRVFRSHWRYLASWWANRSYRGLRWCVRQLRLVTLLRRYR